MKKASTFQFDFSKEVSSSNVSATHLHVEEVFLRGMNFGRIYDFYSDGLDNLNGYDGILIRFTNDRFTKQLIASIRATRQKFIYLLPVFLESPIDNTTAFSELRTIDGIIQNVKDVGEKLDQVQHLLGRIREIRLTQFVRYDDAVLFSFLFLFCTRDL